MSEQGLLYSAEPLAMVLLGEIEVVELPKVKSTESLLAQAF